MAALGTLHMISAKQTCIRVPCRPNEGVLRFNVEFSPMASPDFEGGRPSESAIEMIRLLEHVLRNSRAVDREALCVLAGHKVSGSAHFHCTGMAPCCPAHPMLVGCMFCIPGCFEIACAVLSASWHILPRGVVPIWSRLSLVGRGLRAESESWFLQVWHLDISVTILDHAGNLTDACLLSAVAALMVFRRPEVEVAAGDGATGSARTIVLSPAVREPLPLSLHQLPLSATFAVFGVRTCSLGRGCLNLMYGLKYFHRETQVQLPSTRTLKPTA